MEVLTPMNLEAALQNFNINIKYPINEKVSDYLGYTEESIFFIEPTVQDVKINNKLPTKGSKFVLFSAPGATGKSTLARHISQKYNALYWDLSKVKLGTNSFIGTVLSAVGNENFSKYISDLSNSRAFLVIDALDEAEIVSGRNMLNNFILEINENINDCVSPCIVLLSRTETAQFIVSLCSEHRIALNHYEIGFFSEDKSKEFLQKSIDAKTKADFECIETYYHAVSEHISESEGTSLLGYAPVLEAIAKNIKENNNRSKLTSNLTSKQSYISIISKIMDSLLKREHEKVKDAFIKGHSEKYPYFTNWDNVYSEEEQLNRIMSYILLDDPTNDIRCDFLPDDMIDDYYTIIESFIPQHPFITNSISRNKAIDFTGPAFRDYSLVRLLLSNEPSYAFLYLEESINRHYIPSRIFYDYYKMICVGTVYSDHLSYLYDSFKSRATAKEYANMQCMQIDGNEINAEVFFEMNSQNENNSNLNPNESFNLVVNNNRIVLSQCSNVTINLPNALLQIGLKNSTCRIQNASIICKKIEWSANTIIFESFSDDSCLLVCKEPISPGTRPDFDVKDAKNIYIDIPNIKDFYKLIPYKFNFDSTDKVEPVKFANALRMIMFEFRTHKKDTLAKDADRIDNVIVGSSEFKKSVLEFLLYKKIVFRAEHLYKIDLERMNNAKLNYLDLRNLNTNAYDDFFKEYLSFLRKD